MTTARIELPPKLIPVFSGKADYRGAYGGRGSGKTRSFALMTAVYGYKFGQAGVSGLIVCAREYMNSLEDSSLEEVKEAIRSVDWLADYYEIGEKYIRSKDGRIKYSFTGLNRNLNSIKGKSRILIAWVDEAEPVSQAAWDKLDATIREEGSELWATWNPEDEDSETKKRFQDNPPPNSKIVPINWRDNPWFPERLNRIRLRKQKQDPDRYAWEWEGQCLTRTDAQIFAGKWSVEDFEPDPSTWDGPYFGLDWGFSVDPTAATKSWINNDTLYIEYEAGQVGLELDDVAAFMRERLPGIDRHIVRADNARPESISFVKRNGLPRTIPAKKWQGSVQDGIEHIRSYKQVVIHPRCKKTATEFRLYSYKIDKQSGDVLPVVIDLNNHCIDSIRYALEPIVGAALERKRGKKQPQKKQDRWDRAFAKTSGDSSWIV